MNVKPKPTNAEIKKVENNAPKRGSVGYWFPIVVFLFFIPALFISVALTLLLGMLAILVGEPVYLLGPVIGLISGFLIARRFHRKSWAMDEKQYVQYMKKFSYQNTSTQRTYGSNDSGCPLDPASSSYWTSGPGSSTYKNRY